MSVGALEIRRGRLWLRKGGGWGVEGNRRGWGAFEVGRSGEGGMLVGDGAKKICCRHPLPRDGQSGAA